MVDEDFRVWLIECNTNPYFGIPNQFIADLLPRMISEMFEITIDPVYPPKRKYPLLEKNFELIYSKDNNTRRPYDTPVYPVKAPDRLALVSRTGLRSRQRRSRVAYKRNHSYVEKQKKPSVPKISELRKKAISNVRKAISYKSTARELERTYLSSGGKPKSPMSKKSGFKFDGRNRVNSGDQAKSTITPRSKTTKRNNLQISITILTDELISGRANGEYKMKSFNMVMNRIFQKLYACSVLLNKKTFDMEDTTDHKLYTSTLPSISEENNIDLKQLKSNVIEPVCQSLGKLSKSKYIMKIGDKEGGVILNKLLKSAKALIEDQSLNWLENDDLKEQRICKADLVNSILETLAIITKNDKIRNIYIDDGAITKLIELFLWTDKYKIEKPYKNIYETILNFF